MSVFSQRVKDASEAADHQLIGPDGRGITVFLQAYGSQQDPRDR